MLRTVVASLFVFLALSGGSRAAEKSAFDKPSMEAYLRHQFMLPASLKVIVGDPKPSEVAGLMAVDITVTDGRNMNQQVQFLVSKDGKKILQSKVLDIRESPFANDLKLLRTEGAPVAGPPAAPVTLVVFSDFQCQFCKEEAKTLRANLEKTYPTDVKMVFKAFPLEQIHPWAKTAAMIGQCVHRLNQGAFWQFHDWIFDQQSQISLENVKPKSLEFANSHGVDSLQLTQCIDGKLTEKDIERSEGEARALQINQTPTLFVNGRRLVGNVPWEQLKQVIDYEVDYSKKERAAKKDEACCEVKLAIPVK